MASNVVALFSDPIPEVDIRTITGNVIDWAEKSGVDIHDPEFRIKSTTLVTLMQVIFNESRKI